MGTVWMDFSGAPAIVIAECALACWSGFYLPIADDESIPDIELPDGRKLVMDTTFDFEHPITDYDRVCARREELFVYPVGSSEALVISNGADRVGYWAEERIVLTGGRQPPASRLDRLLWKQAARWRVTASPLVLMNSCDYGEDPLPTQRTRVDLTPGNYIIETAQAVDEENPFVVSLCRLRRV